MHLSVVVSVPNGHYGIELFTLPALTKSLCRAYDFLMGVQLISCSSTRGISEKVDGKSAMVFVFAFVVVATGFLIYVLVQFHRELWSRRNRRHR